MPTLQRGTLRAGEQRHPRSQVIDRWTTPGLSTARDTVLRLPVGSSVRHTSGTKKPLLAHEPSDGTGWCGDDVPGLSPLLEQVLTSRHQIRIPADLDTHSPDNNILGRASSWSHNHLLGRCPGQKMLRGGTQSA